MLYHSQIKPVKRDIIETTHITDPHWISGFVSGEGNFDAGIRKATMDRPERVYLRFRITQNIRDLSLMNLIIKYLDAGRIDFDKRKDNSTINLVVGDFSDITDKIILDQYLIFGVKILDYHDWVKIANLMKLGKNKTLDGMEEIKFIERGMNKGRSF